MKRSDLVIVGGSAAGVEAAIIGSRQHGIDNITVIRREQKVMVPCGIPYIFGTLGSAEKNILSDTLLGDTELIIDEAVSIDPKAQSIVTAGGKAIGYEKLILATGSQPAAPPIPGRELDNVFTVRKDIEYLQSLERALDYAETVVIIGGGFIGVEFADECKRRGLNVTIVELLPHCLLLNCDEEFCIRAEEELTKRGVKIICGNKVSAILGDHRVKEVELATGERLKADVVIIAIGVAPDTRLAQQAGLEAGDFKGIKVDLYGRTSVPNIFAAGDCAEKSSFFTGKPVGLRLASIAAHEARIAAINLFEPRVENRGAIGVFSTKIGDIAFGAAGLTQRAAMEAGFDIVVGRAGAVDKHPGSMPGAQQLQVKLVFDRMSRRLIGGEASGGVSVGEVVNIVATAIGNGMTAYQIATLQIGTHPALTASPIAYQLIDAAERAFPSRDW